MTLVSMKCLHVHVYQCGGSGVAEYIYIIRLLYDNLLLLVMPVLSHRMHSIMKTVF